MARLWTAGFESGVAYATGLGPDGISGLGTLSFVTSPVRSGAFALGVPSPGNPTLRFTIAGVLGRTYFVRAYIRVDTLFDAQFGILGLGLSNQAYIHLTTSGTLQLRVGTLGNTQVGSDSAALNLGQWHMVEMSASTSVGGTDTAAARLDGVQFASGTGLTFSDSSLDHANCGVVTGGPGGSSPPTTGQAYIDDLAVNDDQGASQNSWPGSGKVVMLKPKADSARGSNWLAGAGGTTNLWDAVDNTPPVGVIVGSATNTSQVKNSAKDTAGLYDAAVEAYDVAVASGGGGLAAVDTITLTQPVASVGSGGTVAIQHGLAGASNPTAAEATVTTAASAAGTWPSNWINLFGTVAYAPSVTKTTRPVLRLRKGTSSTTAAMAAFMGLLVEYVPGRNPARPTLVNQAVNRATTR